MPRVGKLQLGVRGPAGIAGERAHRLCRQQARQREAHDEHARPMRFIEGALEMQQRQIERLQQE